MVKAGDDTSQQGEAERAGRMDQNQENELIVRILQGERDAYALLVEAYKAQIFNLAYRMTGSYEDAADLTQETFFRTYANLKTFQAGQRFYTWLYTIGLNIIRNHLRKKETLRRLKSLNPFGEVPDDCKADNQEEEFLEKERAGKVQQALLKLPKDQREVLVLRFYQGLSFEEIGRVASLSESAVKMRAYRGLEKLRVIMEKV